jgi:phosphate transport system permease protein
MSGADADGWGGAEAFEPRREARRRLGTAFKWLCFAAVVFGVVSLLVLLSDVFVDGIAWVDWAFLTSYPSRFPEQAGIRSALLGTLWLMLLVALISFPLGVGAAIYLEEYAPENWFTRALQMTISNLAAVPSVVYGILGLAVFVRFMALGHSVLAGALTLSLLIVPVTIIAAQEAIRAVPPSLRHASYGIGATKWQTIRHTCCRWRSPASSPGPSSPSPGPSARPRPSCWWEP